MEDTLKQLVQLLLGSIPTIVLFVLLYASYRAIVHKPMSRILAERKAKTEGALEKARADISAAEARTAEYESSLREARVSIFKAQEARRKQALELRTAAIAEARAKAVAEVNSAKASIASEMAVSKSTIQSEAERLASEVITRIFRQVGAAQQPMGGVQ
jgi:F-type H+-transporting ATPase subunit b